MSFFILKLYFYFKFQDQITLAAIYINFIVLYTLTACLFFISLFLGWCINETSEQRLSNDIFLLGATKRPVPESFTQHLLDFSVSDRLPRCTHQRPPYAIPAAISCCKQTIYFDRCSLATISGPAWPYRGALDTVLCSDRWTLTPPSSSMITERVDLKIRLFKAALN